MLLGNTLKRHRRFTYRTLTVYGRPSQIIRLHLCFLTLRPGSGQIRRVPQPRTRNARRLEHVPGLASSAFAHHYSRNHYCFLFLRVLRCFTSPRSPPTPMYSVPGDTTSLVPGFPIRTSSDQRLLSGSPRLIAAGYVLHRRLAPRHPPCALSSLTIIGKTRSKTDFWFYRVSYHALALFEYILATRPLFADARRRLPIMQLSKTYEYRNESLKLASLNVC